MNFTLKELLDIPRLRELLDSLDEIDTLPSAVLDAEGTVLTATAWQDICTKFHRVNPDTKKKCSESDQHIKTALGNKTPQEIYRCPMGLIDAAAPIIIDGRHLGTVFTGQVFMEPPDEAYFIRQAHQYGFNESEYLAAMRKVPVFPEVKLRKNLSFICSLVQLLAEQGLQHNRQREAEAALRASERALQALKDTLQEQYEELQLNEEALRDQNDKLLAAEEMLRGRIDDYEISQRLLKDSEERFRVLHDSTFGGLFIHENGIILDCNQGLSDITGFTCEELVGMNGFKLIAPEWLDRVLQNIKNGFDRRYEVEGLRKDGTRYPLSVIGKNIPYKEGTARVIEYRDISELKRMEESLRKSKRQYDNLVSRISVGIYILHSTQDGAFALDYVSPVMAEMFNVSIEALLADAQILFHMIHPDDVNSFVKLNQTQIHLQQPFNWEGRFLVDGTLKWLRFKSSPEPLENGDILWHGVVSDITESKKHEVEQLKIEKLESLGVLAGGIAHDFNNILTGIRGNISFAQVFLDATHKSFKPLVEAEKASVRATELAHQLLTFARGGEPVKKLVSVQHLVDESVSLVLHGSNVKISVDIPDSIHAIEADEGQISQVFHNIIINATQAMPGGGTLTVAARNETLGDNAPLPLPRGTYIRLTFADQGCGISDENLKRIFDPYFTTKLDGNGLGLSSAYSIVSRHGGHIGVVSVAGKGTTFTIHLPSIGETYSERLTDSCAQIVGDHTGGSILVMDDEEMIRHMTGEILEYLGYRVTTCDDGAEATTKYMAAMESGKPFSAVIMDLTIPGGMGGKETAERIRAIDPKARLIVSSGYSNDPIMSDYSTYGFNAAVAKPYNIKELAQLLSSVLPDR